MENQESTEEAAIRETWEEAKAEVNLLRLFTMLSVPEIDQVHIFFLAEMKHGGFGAGAETLECRLFDQSEIPWNDIAFPTVKKTLRYYFDDLNSGAHHLSTRVEDIRRPKPKPV